MGEAILNTPEVKATSYSLGDLDYLFLTEKSILSRLEEARATVQTVKKDLSEHYNLMLSVCKELKAANPGIAGFIANMIGGKGENNKDSGKKRGRPKGSKNTVKPETAPVS